jgi:hypothetical protein
MAACLRVRTPDMTPYHQSVEGRNQDGCRVLTPFAAEICYVNICRYRRERKGLVRYRRKGDKIVLKGAKRETADVRELTRRRRVVVGGKEGEEVGLLQS